MSASVEELVVHALDPLRAHKGRLPDKRTLPALVVQVVAGTNEYSLMGADGFGRRIVQLDAYATAEFNADEYMKQARDKMRNAEAFVCNGDEVAAPGFEDEPALYRSSWQFIIWLDDDNA